MSLDDLDLNILALLQKNAKAKLSAIAKEVHLSVTAVNRRIERMEDIGVIRGYQTLIDPEKVGIGVHGFLIGGVYHVMLDRFYTYISSVPEVTRCETIISGGKEVLLEFYCKDVDALMAFYNSDIRKYLDSMTVYLVKGVPGKDSPVSFN
ncbi:Lrp/AsnC family transcriptional regulator [uncultured Oscillibacter sp.]|uniref:Lrp/AsnC family transcriptional regulator n=1 Tax=uncultured Oscillibacter sp. TaxID=876091 RepID=UPI0025F869E3|nr:Lrp/AsnC family transcriptional regulator [uncultured Oscillibacter sp.]